MTVSVSSSIHSAAIKNTLALMLLMRKGGWSIGGCTTTSQSHKLSEVNMASCQQFLPMVHDKARHVGYTPYYLMQDEHAPTVQCRVVGLLT
ncbi:hypothetical protein M8818_002744 [Zalaria obscura]|uniref:Uncharacterized protein n=1 Tax=Zalaria obscura TaxID=2024903 RepID=A0ACC3SGS2_9PEZI